MIERVPSFSISSLGPCGIRRIAGVFLLRNSHRPVQESARSPGIPTVTLMYREFRLNSAPVARALQSKSGEIFKFRRFHSLSAWTLQETTWGKSRLIGRGAGDLPCAGHIQLSQARQPHRIQTQVIVPARR